MNVLPLLPGNIGRFQPALIFDHGQMADHAFEGDGGYQSDNRVGMVAVDGDGILGNLVADRADENLPLRLGDHIVIFAAKGVDGNLDLVFVDPVFEMLFILAEDFRRITRFQRVLAAKKFPVESIEIIKIGVIG